jgi:enoyl-CoA hydratase/carnithine racemase
VATDHPLADLSYEVTDAIGIIRIGRAEKLGAFTWPMLERWTEALIEARSDDAVRAVVLVGTTTTFCSGVDLAELAAVGSSPIDRKRMLTDRVHNIARAVQALDKPLICGVAGPAIGAGMDMALMCDIRLAAESARFSEGYIRVGLVPGDGGAYYLPRIVGTARALELLWTGDVLSAREALEFGIVNRVVADESLFDETCALAARIASMSPIATRMIKRLVYQSARLDLETSLDLVSSHMAIVQSTRDYDEVAAARRESRQPVFEGQ